MKKISFSEAAKFANITRDQLRYWIKLLDIKHIKGGRTLFLPSGSEILLEAMNKSVKAGLSLKAAAKEVLTIHALPTIHKKEMVNVLTDRIVSLEKAVMLLVEQNKALSDKNEIQNKLFVENFNKQENRLKQIVMKMEKLEPPQKTQIKVWKPSKPNHPKISTIKRLWYEIISPEKLRAN